MIINVAIISDTHAHLDQRVIDLIKKCDYAVHAGDICGKAILKEMNPKTGKIIAVAGNNDFYCHEHLLPDSSELKLPGGMLNIEHGHVHGMSQPCHQSLRKHYPNARAIVYGHTHKMVVDKDQSPWVINPGAAGKTRTHGGPSCLVLEASEKDWHIHKFRFAE